MIWLEFKFSKSTTSTTENSINIINEKRSLLLGAYFSTVQILYYDDDDDFKHLLFLTFISS